ncbi:hypothetical protein BJX64DRAFT_250986 [Aspergillus heterothallicus]
MSLRHSQSARSPPHTPQQQLRSNNNSFASNSSGSNYRVEEDAIIFELGARWLRAGFEGESEPKCIVGFGPEESRRVGDYRGWLRGTAAEQETPTRSLKPEDWSRPYELWSLDLRNVDLGLVEDKIERSVRETYNKYLLTDTGVARLVLVLPSVMPHPLLSSILTTLFSRWRFPSITLLDNATMATTAAGLRSALVVDIGWAETVVTGIYEYREVATKRSTRAMKALIHETGRLITQVTGGELGLGGTISVDFEYCEEVASRFLWCKPSRSTGQDTLASIADKTVSIPSPSDPGSSYIDLPFSKLTEPVERVFFAQGFEDADLDDEEKPLSLVIYNTLVSLPPDVRGICMARIVFIGGGANIAGVRRRVLDEIGSLVKQYGWSPVRGKVIDQNIKKLKDLKISRPPPPNYETAKEQTDSDSSASEGGYETADEPDTEIDPIEQKLQRSREKEAVPVVQGVIREVETLGSWAGASLTTSLKVRGLVEIEREKYLQHGLAGATREWDHSHKDAKDPNAHSQIPDRRSGLRNGGDRSSWTLAGWG